MRRTARCTTRCACSQTVKSTSVLPGGGAPEMLMAHAVDEAAKTVGSKHTLALTQAGGHVYAWGYGGGGRLGCGDSRGQFRPKLVEALRELPCMLVAAGDSHSMALTTDKGHLYTWGLGDYGKLGHGDTTPALNPRHLEFFRAERLVWAAGGSFHSAAVVELTGLVYTWGGGSYGKLDE